jgi:N-acyl-D-amino-acid deacylase
LSSEPYDLVIFGGSIVDGTGNPRFAGDVAVDHGRVVRVGDLSQMRAKRRIDAGGKIVGMAVS